MEKQKIVNLLNDSNSENSKFATTKNGVLLTVKQTVITYTTMKLNF